MRHFKWFDLYEMKKWNLVEMEKRLVITQTVRGVTAKKAIAIMNMSCNHRAVLVGQV